MSESDVALAAQLGQQLLAQVGALESRLDAANTALVAANEARDDAERLAARRATALSECEQRFQHSVQETEQVFKALASAEQRVRDGELAQRSLTDEWRVANEESRRLAVANEALEAELAELKRSVRSSRQRAATDATAATNDARLADELATQLAAATARNSLLESTVSDAAAEIASLRAALDGFGDLTAQLSLLRDANADLVRQLADARSEAASLADTVSTAGAANLHHSLSAVDLTADDPAGGAGAASVLDELRELMSSPSSVASPPPQLVQQQQIIVVAAPPATPPTAKSGELRMRLQLVGGAAPMPWSRRRITVQAGALIFHGHAVEQTAVQRPDGEPLQLPRQGVLALRGASVKLAPAEGGGGAVLTLGIRHILLDAKSAEAIGATYRFYEFVDASDGDGDDGELLAWASALETAVRDASPAAPSTSKARAPSDAAAPNAAKECVVLVENEYRLSPFHSWRPSEAGALASFVSGSDMPHWTTAVDSTATRAKEAFECPGGFVWAADKWSLCEPPNTGLFVSETQARTDLNGWQYSAKWSLPQHKWQAGPSASCSVRRRFWKRNKVAAAVNQQR